MICPSRSRPGNIQRLAAAWPQVTDAAALLVVCDGDDPQLPGYEQVIGEPGAPGQVTMLTVPGGPHRLGPVLNMAVPTALGYGTGAIGFISDSHLPITPDWDTHLTAAISERPGVAYGDDLFQGRALPTCPVITASVIRCLGYLSPPGIVHLYIDDFWRQLGLDLGHLAYVPGVVVEHLHPAAGKAAWDRQWTANNTSDQYARDHATFQAFLDGQWPADLAALRAHLAATAPVRPG